MILLIGLIVLIAAIVVGVSAISANSGQGHMLSTHFTIFDHQFSGSESQLFAAGAGVGAVAMLGLVLLLTGLFGTQRRHAQTRRELRQTRREATAAQRDLAKTGPAPVATPAVSKPAVTKPAATATS
ncbi:hypothetical protein [Nocardia aurantia]|uniref:Lipopolysaccharide assembly protein A domain-containing protein n=1 Tax=Nocardia aurantia TaxID=2585199 RepID=A0A7K0DKP8_9NOCA|nr:hypothetical protein [Nocardia aurantia]MQY26211.1 hypothetical protein [Nocardia aurantia]